MKILALDHGVKRVGLAIGDTETKLALPRGVLEGLTETELMARLGEIVAEEEIEKIVVGEPLSLTGKESAQTIISQQFAGSLAKGLTVPVELFDERLTSRRAEAATFGAGAPVRHIDELAAMFLLQDYLERQATNHNL